MKLSSFRRRLRSIEMTLQFEDILLEEKGPVAWITLNRPKHNNAFANDMRDELLQALMACQEDEDVRVIVITGAGQCFCAGGDIQQMNQMKEENLGFDKLQPLLDMGRRVVTLIHQMPKPVVAMVNGPTSGAGCSLALACDVRIAGENSSFQQSFIRSGLHPDWGGSYFLPRLVGISRAMELMWTGRKVEAEEAEELGMVQMVVPQTHLHEYTVRFTERMAKGPALSLHLIKMALYNSLNLDLESVLEYENEAQKRCWESTESSIGIQATARKKRRLFEQS